MQVKTKLDRIEIDSAGNISVQLLKQVFVAGDAPIASEVHRTTIDWGRPVADCLGVVSAHLVTMGFPAVADADVARIAACAAAGRAGLTPPVETQLEPMAAAQPAAAQA